MSIADLNEPLAQATAERYGYERHDTNWEAVVQADGVDVISIVVANSLHRPILEAALAAGKHVLCEKPLSDTLDNARAMAQAANDADTIARLGFVYRRAPGWPRSATSSPTAPSAPRCTSRAATGPTTAATPSRR